MIVSDVARLLGKLLILGAAVYVGTRAFDAIVRSVGVR